jgi:uncharacterized membrane protein YjjP (DUF1212 family)
MTESQPKVDPRQFLEFLYRLGQAYLACGEQTAKVELQLRRIAAAQGFRRSRVVAFPTALFIILVEGDEDHVTVAEGPLATVRRLDQIADIYRLGEEAGRERIDPQEGMARINQILSSRSRFGLVGALIGHAVLAAGLAMILSPDYTNLAAATALGLVVGVIKQLSERWPIPGAPLAVLIAALVASAVFLAIKFGLALNPLHVLVPPLITFLPGAMITTGMIELAYGDMVSGSGRLMTGLIHLVLLAFGLAAGAAVIGYGAAELLGALDAVAQQRWEPWVGVLVFGLGVYVYRAAPRDSIIWLLLVLMCTFFAQRLGCQAFGATFSGFFGSLVATPLGFLIQFRFKGPPAVVTFLPSFWLLVPGAFSLISTKHLLSDRQAGLEGMVEAIFVFASIALGTLVGASLYRWATESLGAWQLQVGRALPRGKSRRKPPDTGAEPDPEHNPPPAHDRPG